MRWQARSSCATGRMEALSRTLYMHYLQAQTTQRRLTGERGARARPVATAIPKACSGRQTRSNTELERPVTRKTPSN